MALTNEEIIAALGEKTLIELAELRDQICETFGVTATAAVAVAAEGGAEAAEQTEFDVVLEGFGDNKIAVIKAVREITGEGLKEAKATVESAPCTLLEKVDQAKADEVKEKLEGAGAAVTIK